MRGLVPLTLPCLAVIAALAPCTFGAESNLEAKRIEALRREVKALERLRQRKLDVLEEKEAARWQQRYLQAQGAESHQEEVRAGEAEYARVASELGRVQQERVRARGEAKTAEEEAEAANTAASEFERVVSGAVDRLSKALSGDFPLGMGQRMRRLASLSEVVETPGNAEGGVLGYFTLRLDRLAATIQRDFHRTTALFDTEESGAWRLRLGTVLVLDVERKSPNRVRALLRTGRMDGRLYQWVAVESDDLRDRLTALPGEVLGTTGPVMVPMDVLQNNSLRRPGGAKAAHGTGPRLLAWFRAGGEVMVPLLLAAALALLMCAERYWFFWRKTASKSFWRGLDPLLSHSAWDEALAYCNRSRTSLAVVLKSALQQIGQSRETAEKSVQEAMLREIPSLERRLGLIAALGGAAPLLGLLGTVSGMITLFGIITEAGTNDPKILAGGISEALITTQTGLVIAIPILLLHGHLTERLDRIRTAISSSTAAVLNRVWMRDTGSAPAATGAAAETHMPNISA